MDIKKFIDYFTPNRETEDYIDQISLIRESFDTSFTYEKIKGKRADYYFIDKEHTNNKEYVVFVEMKNEIAHVGFFRKLRKNQWDKDMFTKDLTTKQVLGLFGTIYKVLDHYDYNAIVATTKDGKKLQTYYKVMDKLGGKLGMSISLSDNDIMLYKYMAKPPDKKRFNFKMKKQMNLDQLKDN